MGLGSAGGRRGSSTKTFAPAGWSKCLRHGARLGNPYGCCAPPTAARPCAHSASRRSSPRLPPSPARQGGEKYRSSPKFRRQETELQVLEFEVLEFQVLGIGRRSALLAHPRHAFGRRECLLFGVDRT